MARPINADVPASDSSDAPAPTRRPRRRRGPIPAALKAVAGLFLLAIVFLVAAILGGGSGDGEAPRAPAPVVEAPGAGEETSEQTASELGFPAFATANTTRVGGADPAATAAAVALAAYPAARAGQRPDAVTLVGGADWRGAIAAAVLMAPPVGAPPLLSDADELPEASAEALASLDPRGSRETGGAQVFALGAATAPPGDLRLNRVRAGGSAGAAAIMALREKLVGEPPAHIVVAPAAEPAFAMPAAAWAARSGDPVLFSGRDDLDKPTARALRANPGVPVYVLGPSSAISSNAVRQIGRIVKQVRRVSGEDPVANAIELARYADGDFGWNVNDPGHGFVIARAGEPLEAAAASPLSASGTWGPLLLSDDAATLPAALRGYLLDVKPGYTTDPTRAFYNHVWVIGDQEAIDVNQQAEIDELAALAKIGGKP